jgi:uncharacterized protein (DUF58 family)
MAGHSAKSFAINHRFPTRLPLTLQRRGIRIRPTRHGVIFIALVLSMFLGSLNYNNNLGFLLTFLLGSIAFVSIANTYKNFAGITIVSSFTRPVFAGQKAAFEFIISGGATNRVRIGFAFEGHPIAYHDFVGHTDNRIQVFARAASRGSLKPGPLLIHSDYPLGLFRVGRRIDPDLECIVYPKPLPGNLKTIDARSPAGGDVNYGGPGSDDFTGLKSYAPGDPIQRIAWKASSRGQGLFTKDFIGQYGSAVFLDWHSLKAPDPEQKLSLLCHMVLKAYQNDLSFGLRLPGNNLGPSKGRGHKIRCLKALALF